LIQVCPLFFEQGQAAYGCLALCSKNTTGYHPLCLPKLCGESQLDRILFFREAFSDGLSFLNPFFLSFFIYFPATPEVSTLLLTLSRKKLVRVQCSFFTCTISKNLFVWNNDPLLFFTSEKNDQNSSPLSGHWQ
jgi:hypothetical protein